MPVERNYMKAIPYIYKGAKQSLNPEDVLYFTSSDKYVEAHLLDGGMVLLDQSLITLIGMLPADMFTRVHRSYIVRESYMIKTYSNKKNGWVVILKGLDLEIPIGRRLYKEVRKLVQYNHRNNLHR